MLNMRQFGLIVFSRTIGGVEMGFTSYNFEKPVDRLMHRGTDIHGFKMRLSAKEVV